MVLEHRFACPLPNGLHARPASHLEAVASRFPAAATLVNERTGVEANAKSVLALISADIHPGDPLLLRVDGSGAEAAFADLTRFLRDDFAACDSALPPVPARTENSALPRSLQAAAPVQILRGTALCRGLAEGRVRRAQGLCLTSAWQQKLAAQTNVSVADEWERFKRAVGGVRLGLEKETASASGPQAEILRTHIALLEDLTFAETVSGILNRASSAAGHAVLAAVAEFSDTLRQSSSVYLQERVLDLQDIGARLLGEMYGPEAVLLGPQLDQPSIVVAESLTPGQLLALNRVHLRGLVLRQAGSTSHTVILARSFGLPTLVGVEGVTDLPEKSEAILDANLGLLLPSPNEATQRYYALEERRLGRTAARTRAFTAAPGASRDGQPLPVLANVASAPEVARAVAEGADGVGLFRTEMLYLDRGAAPSEEEQTEVYTAAIRAAAGRPVTLRTFDIGGDKPAPYLHLPTETNPFLGYRGARLYDDFADLLKTQLRAIFRAAAHGPVRIMAPMIAVPEEMARFRAVVEDVRADFPPCEVPVGMMIEIPSAAYALPEFAPYADFFSLGTNDLLQYFLAADRDNGRVAALSSPWHPAFLRCLRQIVGEAHRLGRTVGLCGELGERAEALPVLLGLGLDSISLGAHRLPATKAELAALDFPSCRQQLEGLLTCADRPALESRLREHRRTAAPRPLLALELVQAESASRTKHEVIKELTDLLAADGRLGDATAVEETIWQREEVYSTGFGYGFAVPHCQSGEVQAGSIAIVRLCDPIDWGALDGQPVRTVILIALRPDEQGREHLRIFAKLSRLVMREEFRARLEQAADAHAILSTLQGELTLPPPPSTPLPSV